MKPKHWKVVSVAALLLTAGGCGQGAFRTVDFNENGSVLVDARHRAIVNTSIGGNWDGPGQVKPTRVICAEPSPDVALAVANSLGAGISIFGKGSGSFEASQAKGLAQLAERTVTIQYLRDGLYQACQAYANGAINSTTYAVLLSKLDETLVTTMLGEMAAGAFGRDLASVRTTTDGASLALVGLAAGDADKSQELLDALLEANATVEAKAERAGADRAAAAANPNDSAAKAAAARSQSELEAAQAQREALAKAAREQAATAARSVAKAEEAIGGGAIDTTRTGTQTAAVAAEIRRIHAQFLNEFGFDALMVACIQALDRPKPEASTALKSNCEQLLDHAKLEGLLREQNQRVLALAAFEQSVTHWQSIAAVAELCGEADTPEKRDACRVLAAKVPASPEVPTLRPAEMISLEAGRP